MSRLGFREQFNNPGLLHGQRIFTLLTALIALSPAVHAAAVLDGQSSTPRPPDTVWVLNGYNMGQACRGFGSTNAGSMSTIGCSKVSNKGIVKYSYDGVGMFKLQGYDNLDCTGNTIVSVNGGSVTCLDAPDNWKAYNVVRAT